MHGITATLKSDPIINLMFFIFISRGFIVSSLCGLYCVWMYVGTSAFLMYWCEQSSHAQSLSMVTFPMVTCQNIAWMKKGGEKEGERGRNRGRKETLKYGGENNKRWRLLCSSLWKKPGGKYPCVPKQNTVGKWNTVYWMSGCNWTNLQLFLH